MLNADYYKAFSICSILFYLSKCNSFGIDYRFLTAFATSLVNIFAIAYKDKEYAKLYSNKNTTSFPKTSYGLFALRDSLTITSSFVIKHDFISYLEKSFQMSHNNADLIASFTIPMAAQVISTPVHVLALDIYGRPNATFSQRTEHILKCNRSVCLGRILRIIPAFGVGGFLISSKQFCMVRLHLV
jgi:hypothetical protein